MSNESLKQAYRQAKKIAKGDLKPTAKRKAIKEWCASMTAFIRSGRHE